MDNNYFETNTGNESTPYNVLIVDDDRAVSEMLALCLEDRGINVVQAQNGREAIEALSGFTPDVIVLDIMMPELTGHDVLKHVKSKDDLRYIPIIMLTAQQQQRDVGAAFDAGAAEYFVKPLKPEKFMVKLEEILEFTRKKILIVENEAETRDFLADIYREKGFQTETAQSGFEAWKKIQATSFDLIVLNWGLPNMGALDLMKKLRSEQGDESIPVMVLADKSSDPTNPSDDTNYDRVYMLPDLKVPTDILKRSIALL